MLPRTPHNRLAELARTFVGTREEGGENQGPWIENFQRSIDGKPGGAWCMAFVYYCVNKVAKEFGIEHTLYASKSVLTAWENSPKKSRQAATGLIPCWQVGRTRAGHAGIVWAVTGVGRMTTIEGNTALRTKIVREGDGVYERDRYSVRLENSEFQLLGFIDPF